jgi:hypothetical protein
MPDHLSAASFEQEVLKRKKVSLEGTFAIKAKNATEIEQIINPQQNLEVAADETYHQIDTLIKIVKKETELEVDRIGFDDNMSGKTAGELYQNIQNLLEVKKIIKKFVLSEGFEDPTELQHSIAPLVAFQIDINLADRISSTEFTKTYLAEFEDLQELILSFVDKYTELPLYKVQNSKESL